MIGAVKDYIKTKPRLYDWFNAWRAPQNQMEQWLDTFSRRHKPVRFIQIGASDGLRWDPFRPFIVRDGWQGLLVEPLPWSFPLLRKNYAYLSQQGLKFVNAAISTQDGQVTFWTYTEAFLSSLRVEERIRLLGQSSFDRAPVLNAVSMYPHPESCVCGVTVSTLTFGSLLKQHWPNVGIDLVTVDAEGHDDAIIRAMDLKTVRPKAILFEVHNLSEGRRASIYDWLAQYNYRVAQFQGDAVAERLD